MTEQARSQARRPMSSRKATNFQCDVIKVLHTCMGKKGKEEIRIVRWGNSPRTIEKRYFLRQSDGKWRTMSRRGFTADDVKMLLENSRDIQTLLAGGDPLGTETVFEKHLSRFRDVAAHLRVTPKRVLAALFRKEVDDLLAWAQGETPGSESVESQFINVFNFCHLGLVLHRDELDE